MMVRMLVKQPVKPEHSAEVAALMGAAQKIVRTEEGCITYNIYWPEDEKDTLVLYEEWADDAALAGHHQQQHMKDVVSQMKPFIDGKAEILRLVELEN